MRKGTEGPDSHEITIWFGRAVVFKWQSAQESASVSLKSRFPGPGSNGSGRPRNLHF